MNRRILKILATVCCIFVGIFLFGVVYALADSDYTLYIDGTTVDDLNNVQLETGDPYLFEIEGEGNYTDNYLYDWTIPSGSGSLKVEKVSGTDGRQVYVTPTAPTGSMGVTLRYDIHSLNGTYLGSQTVTIFITDVVFPSTLVKDAIAHDLYEVEISKSRYKIAMDAFKEIYELEKPFYFVNSDTDVSIAFNGLDLDDVPKEDYQKTVALGSSFTADRLVRKAVSQFGLSLGYSSFTMNEQYKVLSLSDETYPAEAVVSLNLGKDYADDAYNSELYVYRYDTQTQTLKLSQMAAVTGHSSNYIEITVSQGGCYIFTPYNLLESVSSYENNPSSVYQNGASSSSSGTLISSFNSSVSSEAMTGSSIASSVSGSTGSNNEEPIPFTADRSGVAIPAFLVAVGFACSLGCLIRQRKRNH